VLLLGNNLVPLLQRLMLRFQPGTGGHPERGVGRSLVSLAGGGVCPGSCRFVRMLESIGQQRHPHRHLAVPLPPELPPESSSQSLAQPSPARKGASRFGVRLLAQRGFGPFDQPRAVNVVAGGVVAARTE